MPVSTTIAAMITRVAVPLVAALLLLASPMALAGPGSGPRAAAPALARPSADAAVTLDEAVARLERQYTARAVRAEQDRKEGRVVYRIRLLSADGRVFDVVVDAATGAIE
jgi:uncharacterized membrane protein YkoI